MSRTSITLLGTLVDELMSEVKAKSKTEAVIKAIKDEIRCPEKRKNKSYGRENGVYKIRT